MRTASKVAVSLLAIGAAVAVVPLLDRGATRVSLCVTGIGLALAWYAILDLREQRKENIWPHTVDRLMRATFTAITLVFVADLGFRRPAPTDPPPRAPTTTFSEAVFALVSDNRWSQDQLSELVSLHFKGLRAVFEPGRTVGLGRALQAMVDANHKFVVLVDHDTIVGRLLP